LSDLVDFRFIVDGRTVRWKESIIEHNRHDEEISIWLQRQDKFALRLAVEEELRREGLHRWEIKPCLWGNSDQRLAWLRDRWLSLPLFLRPSLYFFYRYVVTGGFLDGRPGFLYHALQGFWLRLVVDWKIRQLRGLAVRGSTLQAFAQTMFASRTGSVTEVWRSVNSQPSR
jgi:hypothetical protein